MEKETLENHQRYVARIALFKKFGYDLESERDFILQKAKPITGRILEAGTGKGHFALALAREGYPFVTFDVSQEEQHFAKLNLAYWGLEKLADFRIENGERLSFPDGSFDTIFCINALHHLRQPCQVLDELIRVFSKSGKIILSDFTPEGFAVIARIHASEGRIHHNGIASIDEAENYFTKKGFLVERARTELHSVLVIQPSEK